MKQKKIAKFATFGWKIDPIGVKNEMLQILPLLGESAMCPAFEHPETIIQTEPMVLGYFTRPGCGVCSALLPKVERLLTRYPTVRLVRVDVQRWPRLAGQHLVFAVPTLILFYRGREWHRFSRWVSLTELEKALARMVENLPETDE